MTIDQLQSQFAQNQERYLEEWKAFLRFPSISADPAHHGDCLACAGWLLEHVRGMGFATRLLETGGKPVIYGEHRGQPDLPTILLYGHYDVQPVDPVSAWTSPPFEPAVREGRVYARGAQDNKGQLLYALKALETLIRSNALGPTVKVFIEGEEECGSDGLSRRLAEWRDLIRADILMVCDTGAFDERTASIIMGLRGLVHMTVSLGGPLKDLHSGVHGGRAPNPALALARLLATLHRADGRIAVKGYYDGVAQPTPEEREVCNRAPFDAARYRAETGVDPTGGERGFTPAERAGFRPCLDVNGMYGGYAGAGVKTIIPARATAKLTSRLVPGQDPAACLAALERHLQRRAPRGLKLEITERGVGGPPVKLDLNSSVVVKARAVLTALTGREPVLAWEGASIPVVAGLRDVSGGEPLLVGFGLERDRIHAPDESFSIEQFRKGFLFVGMFLGA